MHVCMYIVYVKCFCDDSTPHFNFFFSENQGKLCNVWNIQPYYMLFLIIRNSTCQSD